MRFAGYPHEFTPFGALAPIISIQRVCADFIGIRRPGADLSTYSCSRGRVVAARACTIPLRPHESNAAHVATAYTRAFCTTEVRNSDGGLMKVLAWASHGSRARCEHACRKRRRSHCAADTGRRCWIVVRRHEPHRSNSGPAPRDRRIAAQVSSATTATGAGGVRQRRRSIIARKSIIDMVTSTLGLL